VILNIAIMESKNKLGEKVLRGRPKKEKLSCSINLKLTEKDFNFVKRKRKSWV
jgi:hypothetical protein